MIQRAQPFYTNKLKEITKQPKIFFVDTGIRNTLSKTFSEPDGALFENYVFTELLKIGFSPKYWRTKSKAEVDFIIEKDGEIIPIEAKLSSEHQKIEKSLHSFIQSYTPKRAFIVSYHGSTGKTNVNGCIVHFVNVLELRNMLKTTSEDV